MNLETIDLGTRTLIAIVIGGLANFMVGALWYMALFQKPWMAAIGRTADEFKDKSPSSGMLITLLGCIVSTFALAVVFQWGGGVSIWDGVLVGLLLGLGIAAMEALKPAVYNFDQRVKAWSLYAINASYAVLGTVVAGFVYALIA